MKVVIDTNLLIDGSSDDYNYGNRIIDAVLEGKLEAYANRATLRENMLLSNRKITDTEYLNKLNQYFETVKPAPFVQERINIVSDPEDNKLVESAVASEAEFIVTSDRHLLTIEEYQGIKMVTPAEFWGRFEEETGDSWQNWVKQFMQ